MNESDISSSVAKLSAEFSKLGVSAKELTEAHQRFAEALKKAVDDSIQYCAKVMSEVYKFGITGQLKRKRMFPIKRIIIRRKSRRIVQRMCLQCEYYEQSCPIVKMLPKGRW